MSIAELVQMPQTSWHYVRYAQRTHKRSRTHLSNVLAVVLVVVFEGIFSAIYKRNCFAWDSNSAGALANRERDEPNHFQVVRYAESLPISLSHKYHIYAIAWFVNDLDIFWKYSVCSCRGIRVCVRTLVCMYRRIHSTISTSSQFEANSACS